jgi:glucan 1,3-beta-glucosidase
MLRALLCLSIALRVSSEFFGSDQSFLGAFEASNFSRIVSDTYWMTHMRHGSIPSVPGYKVFRNVVDYGARGDGTTDDSLAINRAIEDGNRCGKNCGSTSVKGAIVYFPSGTYLIKSPLNQLYFTQFIGNPVSRPIIRGSADFRGFALIDTNFYIPNGNGDEWYVPQNQFFRQIRNFVLDMTVIPPSRNPTGIHWQVSQSTSLQNIDFLMPTDPKTTAVGIFTENGSGGFMSDLKFTGGAIGMRVGSQQFTVRNIHFESCRTAIAMIWNWGWTWKGLRIVNCRKAIDMGDATSVVVLDSSFTNVPYGIIAKQGTAITIDNLAVSNVPSIVIVNGKNLLSGGHIVSWATGRRYASGKGSNQTGHLVAPSKSGLLDAAGHIFVRSKPQYEFHSSTDFVNVLDHGVGAKGDQTAAINQVLAKSTGKIVFFPAGIYLVSDTIIVPAGSKIVGELWPQIMAFGPRFSDPKHPKAMVEVGHIGSKGSVEISDMLFTVRGQTAGAVLMLWNIQEDKQGSAAMWDSHFRVGGAVGSNLQAADCPKLRSRCMAATILLHLSSKSTGYFENIWAWTADHDMDTLDQRQIDIFTARGILVESKGPTWMHSVASEHSSLYQIELSGASNIYMGHIQTESPYYQPSPKALQPYRPGLYPNDPLFETCKTPTCEVAWGLRIVNSNDIIIYGAGLYSFFQAYRKACVISEHCQDRILEIVNSNRLWLYDLFTKGAQEVVTPRYVFLSNIAD